MAEEVRDGRGAMAFAATLAHRFLFEPCRHRPHPVFVSLQISEECLALHVAELLIRVASDQHEQAAQIVQRVLCASTDHVASTCLGCTVAARVRTGA